MSRHRFGNCRLVGSFTSINISLAAFTVILLHMVSSEDLNSTTELIEATDLLEAQNQTVSVGAGEKKHPIFNGTLEGFDSALIPGWNANDDFDNWVPPIDIQRIWPSFLSGFDNSGRPVWINEVGNIDVPRYFAGTEKDQEEKLKCHRYIAWLKYKSMSLRSTQENPVTQHIVIIDMEGFKAEFITDLRFYRFIRKWTFSYKKYYEKYAKKIIVINEILVNIFSRSQLKRFPGEVEVYGTNKYEWGPKLSKSVPIDQLPEWYGGNKGFKPVFVVG